ncbi:autophagy- protein 2, partial [Ascosphaera atra]
MFGQGDDEQHRGQDGNYIDEATQSIRSTERSDRVLQEISGNVSLNSTQVREDQMLKEDFGHSSQILSPAKPGPIENGVSAQSMRDDPTDLRKTTEHTDMQASRISSHFPEGEKSMYMSTLSRAGEIEANGLEASSASNAMPRMPGAFGESVYHPPAHSDARTSGETPTKRYSYDAFDNTTKAAKRILNIDKISLSLATPTQQKDEKTTEDRPSSAQQVNEDDDHSSTMKESTMSEAVMGFSVANPPIPMPRDKPNSMHGIRTHQAREKSATGSTQEGYSLDIDVPSIDVCFDTSCGWLAYKMIYQALTGLGGEEGVAPSSGDNDATPITVNARLSTFTFRFVESQPSSTLRPDELYPDQQHEDNPLATILHLTLKEVQAHQEISANEKALRLKVRKITLGHGREDIISFNQGLRMRESIRDMSLTSQDDLSVDLSSTTEGTRVNVNTLPMQLMLNLSLLDETLGWFGGLSSILELGSSIASISTAKEPYKAPAPRKSLGVRFTDDLPPKKADPVEIANAVEVQPSCKVNVRLGGLITYLLGDQCSLKMETSAVKTVSRSTGIAIQVDKGRISGPYLGREFDSRDASGSIELGNARIEFLYTPKESDLAQLLALLTPSRDRYNEDDDIMLDTLFRQRRKGAVLRVTFSTVKASLQELNDLKLLSSLGGDLDKLSRVAKYLPEDDRPGILTLLRVIQLDCGVSVNREVGDITSSLQDFEAAYVGIPSLMSSSVRTARLWRNKEEELLGPVLDDEQLFTSSRDPLPMIMARFVADEMEPTVKVKLWNLRLEYRVPTLMTMLGISDENSAEEFAVEMAKSVMHLADISDRQSEEELLSVDTSSGYDGPRKLAVDLRNCVIGLNPRNSPSRGLCVLTSAEFRGAIQEDLSTEATLNLKEASLMIIDDARNALTHIPSQTRLAPSQDYHAQVLKSLGYVSVCSVSSAGVAIKSMQISDDGEKALDVEIKDNLLLMETCADSTQTLITILSGLSLPTPPVKDLKYRTEVSPMSDVFRFVSSEVVGKEPTSSPGSPISPLGGIPEETNIVEEADYVIDFPSPSSGTGAAQGR